MGRRNVLRVLVGCCYHQAMPVVRVAPFQLFISCSSPHRPLKPYLYKHLLAAHTILNPPVGELSLALVGDTKMSDLHQQFLGIAGPTDVLTFPLQSDAKGRVIGGEVVICVAEARRRCRKSGGKLREELLLYALHGLLHLCGYDDRTDREFKAMHRMEDRILSQLGVGPVFAGGG
jgi:probable rRNA maturation factor